MGKYSFEKVDHFSYSKLLENIVDESGKNHAQRYGFLCQELLKKLLVAAIFIVKIDFFNC